MCLSLGVQSEHFNLTAAYAQEPSAHSARSHEVYMFVKSFGSCTSGNGFADSPFREVLITSAIKSALFTLL